MKVFFAILVLWLSKAEGIFKSKNDNNLSSMRIVFVGVVAFILYIYFDWQKAFLLEIQKAEPNYDGLTTLFLAMMVTFALALLAKVIQKRFEQTDYEVYDEDEEVEQAIEKVRNVIQQKKEQEEYKPPVEVKGYGKKT